MKVLNAMIFTELKTIDTEKELWKNIITFQNWTSFPYSLNEHLDSAYMDCLVREH